MGVFKTDLQRGVADVEHGLERVLVPLLRLASRVSCLLRLVSLASCVSCLLRLVSLALRLPRRAMAQDCVRGCGAHRLWCAQDEHTCMTLY